MPQPNLTPPFRVQIAISASRTVRVLPDEDWPAIRRQLAHIATLAAAIPPPPKVLLEKAGFSPPLFRFRQGQWLVLYDISCVDRTITVLHVVQLFSDAPSLRAQSLRPASGARAPVRPVRPEGPLHASP